MARANVAVYLWALFGKTTCPLAGTATDMRITAQTDAGFIETFFIIDSSNSDL